MLAVLLTAFLLSASAAAGLGGYYSASIFPAPVATLSDPTDVVVAMDGVAFVADALDGRVLGIAADGTPVAVLDGESVAGQELRRPVALDLGPDARVYVADQEADRVSVFERNGTFVRSWTGEGQAGGKLDGPSGIDVDPSGFVYVSDSYRDRVQVFTTAGAYVRTIGSSGAGNANLSSPGALVVSGTELFVADGNNKRVQVFSTAGTALRRWGVTLGDGSNPTTSRYARLGGIEIVGARAFVACTTSPLGDQVVEESDLAGNVVGTWGGPPDVEWPAGLGVTTDGNLLVTDPHLDRVSKFDLTARTFTEPWALGGSTAFGRLTAPGGVDIAADGTVYVADTGNSRVQAFSSSGAFQAEIGTAGPDALVLPEALALSETGEEIYIADSGVDAVVVYAPDGLHQRTIGSGLLADPQAVFVASDRSTYVADTGNDRVVHLAVNGSLIATYGAPGELSAPEGVTVDASGTVFVSDTGNDRLVSFASTSAPAVAIAGSGLAPGQVLDPRGICVDEQGDLVVVDAGNNRLQRFTREGQPDGLLGSRGAGLSEFNAPRGIGVGVGGTVVVADTSNHRVHVLGFDDIAPDTNVSGVPVGWSSTPVTVTLGATDSESGVEAILYRLDASPEATYSAPFVVSAQGETTLLTRARDRAGNAGPLVPTSVRVDSLPPSGTAAWAGGQSVIGTTTLTLAATFADAVEMRTNVTGSWSATSSYVPTRTFTLPGPGTYPVAARYFDWLGNARTDAATVTVDLSAPDVAFTGLPGSGSTTSSVLAGLSASDAPAGVAAVWLSVDGASEQPYVGPVPLSAEGTHTLSARAVDAVGNASVPVTATFTIDRTPPSGTLGLQGGTLLVQDPVFVVIPDIAGAAEMRYEPGWAASEWSTYEPFAELTFPGEGSHPLVAQFRDVAGNKLSFAETVTVDWTPPSTVATGLPQGGPAEGEAVVSLVATDALSGVSSLRYSLNAAPSVAYDGPIAVSTEGTHTLAYSALDRCGNREATQTVQFVVGASVAVDLRLSGGAAAVSTTTVSIESSSSSAVEMQVDSGSGFGPWEPFAATRSLVVGGEGTHTIRVRYRSALGVTATKQATVAVDLSAPSLGGLALEPVRLAESEPGGPLALVLMASWDATDAVSGVARHGWVLGRQRGVAPTQRVELPSFSGGRGFLAYAIDAAGNRAQLRRGIDVGSAPAPWVPASASEQSPPRVVARMSAPGRAHFVVHGFRLQGDGTWARGSQVAGRSLALGGGAVIAARPPVAAGTWRFVVEAVGPDGSRFTRPSSPVTVQ